MKQLKYCITVLLFTILFLISGEISAIYALDQIELYAPRIDISDSTPVDLVQVNHMAAEEDVILYAYDAREDSLVELSQTIYVDSAQVSALSEALHLWTNTIKSLFIYDIKIEYLNFSELDNPTEVMWYLSGDEADCAALLQRMKQAGYEITNYREEKWNPCQFAVYALSVIVIALIAFYTYAEVTYAKKEIYIRLFHGDSLWRNIVWRIALDVIVYSSVFVFLYLLIGKYTAVSMQQPILLQMFCCLQLVNMLPYLTLLRFSAKEVVYGSAYSQRMISVLYLL